VWERTLNGLTRGSGESSPVMMLAQRPSLHVGAVAVNEYTAEHKSQQQDGCRQHDTMLQCFAKSCCRISCWKIDPSRINPSRGSRCLAQFAKHQPDYGKVEGK
jgi:hypothetical protein